MSVRAGAVVAVFVVLLGCGTVSPGQDFEFAQISYDQNFFYCAVEPMLFAEKCGPGEATDPSSGCHFDQTTFRLSDHAPISCSGNTPTGQIPTEAQENYRSAAREMSPDPSQAPLLNRPTADVAHPRMIFKPDSHEADLIRQWATQYTSQ